VEVAKGVGEKVVDGVNKVGHAIAAASEALFAVCERNAA